MGKRGSGYGSEDHLHRYLDEHRRTLNAAVRSELRGGDRTAVTWLPFPRSSAGTEREFTGLEFLGDSTDPALRAAWREFWPSRGRQQTWDAAALMNGEWLLVEAKANHPEFASPPCTAVGAGRRKIEKALNRVKREL